MATPTRLANKTQWALMDIIAATRSATDAWRICHRQAEKVMDPMLLCRLATIRDQLGTIQTRAEEALQGKYSEHPVA